MAKKVQDPALGSEQNPNPEGQFDAKKMLEKNAEAGTKIKYNERLKVEITKDGRYYTKGMIVSPHKVKALALIDQGLAKKYVEKED